MSERLVVLVKGAGDLATGCAIRLHRCGFAVVMTELPEPTAVRRTVAFSEAAVDAMAVVEGVRCRRAESVEDARRIVRAGDVALVVDREGAAVAALTPEAVVDARMAKRNLGTTLAEAPIVIGLGPGFLAGKNVHAVVETNRGHDLGSVILDGHAEPNTGVPGEIGGYDVERLLRAPTSGILRARRRIGDRVEAMEVVAEVGDAPVQAKIAGIVRGLLRDGRVVHEGQKVGDIDPRARREHCFTVSDKARAVAGGVLEAILYLSNTRNPAPARARLPTTTRSSRGAPASRSRNAR